jgi:predicted TIM-barrel fold metal-dependent hydrolase
MPQWSPDGHALFMKDLGIDYSLVSVSSPHINFGTPEYNAELCRACNEEGAALDSKKFGLMASVPVPDVNSAIAEIAYCDEVLHAVGFTLPTNSNGVYIVDPKLEPVFAELNKRKALVTFHPNKPGGMPEGVTPTLPAPLMEFFFDTTRVIAGLILNGWIKKYANIKFLIPHCGAFLGYLADRLKFAKPILMQLGAVDANFDIEAILAGLYYDLGGNPAAKQFPDMRQCVSDTHFCYGSDYPFTPPPLIAQLGADLDSAAYMTDTLREQIYSKNAQAMMSRR